MWTLLIQQFRALLKKNFLLSWRNKRVAFIQLFSSPLVLFLFLCMEKVIDSQFVSSSTAFRNVHDPKSLVFPPIPPCEDKFYVKLPCFDFAWSGNGSARIQSIVHSIMAKNPGRPIPSSKVKSFRTPDEVDAWLYSNPMRCPGALLFVERDATISYRVQTNFTPISKRGHYEDLTFKFQIPLQIAVEREIATSLTGDPNFSWTVGFKEFAHPTVKEFSILAIVGPTYFFVISMCGFVFLISSLVIEKELKLREMMTMMGLYESAYWFSWLTWEGIISFIASVLFVLFGMMLRFDFFLKNSFAVVFMLFFLFQLNMIGFAFILSAFISKSSSSTTMCFSIIFTGFVVQVVTMIEFPYSEYFPYIYRFIWSLFPPNLLAEALSMLANATATSRESGISWSRRAECASNNLECVITMNDIYIWLTTTFFTWFLLAIYINNINQNSSGMRKSWFYFLKPGYWTGRGGNEAEEGGICSCIASVPSVEHITPDDEDVLEEENSIRQQRREGVADVNMAVQICGLAKTYSGKMKISFRKCKKTSPCHALKGLWANVPKNKLFSLLGPNRAGKTTVIDCLTGITPATGGDALIYGYSIRSSIGMSNIRRIIGVCPQSDILWDDLSGQEHLELFSSIKGLPPASIKSVTQKSLADLRLTEAAKMRAGSYSEELKRCLSVAMAFIGDPKLVILDEPTIGMGPITRKHVWDIIENAKNERAILLITQSMEEADMLSDRIGIMAKGSLRCIGTPIWLKTRFGAGCHVHLKFIRNAHPNEDAIANPDQEAVKRLFKLHWDVVPMEEDNTFLTFFIPHDTQTQARLTKVLEELQERQRELGIIDIDVRLSSLKDVFNKIRKKVELESSAAEGSMETET